MSGIKQLMRKDVIVVTADLLLQDLAKLLIKHKMSGAPVVKNEKTNALVGFISERDIIVAIGNGKLCKWK